MKNSDVDAYYGESEAGLDEVDLSFLDEQHFYNLLQLHTAKYGEDEDDENEEKPYLET